MWLCVLLDTDVTFRWFVARLLLLPKDPAAGGAGGNSKGAEVE